MSDIIRLKDRAKNLEALIVEDSITIQKQMRMFLEKLFKKVYVANNGFEGLEVFKRVSPEIILTDLQMPKMDGHEFIENIKRIDDKSQIIVFSAYGHSENIIKFLRMGVTDFIQKPVNFNQLTQSLLKAVNNINGSSIHEFEEEFEDKILKDLKMIKDSKTKVKLVNHYKGLPLIHDAFISSLTKENIAIQTQKIQVKAILEEKSTVIETDDSIVYATLKYHDSQNNELILENLKQMDRSPRHREVIRVTPGKNFTATFFYHSERISPKISYISSKAISFVSNSLSNNKIKLNDFAMLTLGFNTAYTTSYNNIMTHKERIDVKAEIIKLEPLSSNEVKIVMAFSLSMGDRKILEKYIYQREVELIKEFKLLDYDI